MPNLATIAVELSLFALYGSATCIGPYLGTYLVHYGIGALNLYGSIEAISSGLGIIVRLTICSMADRYRAHRIIYLMCTLLYVITGSSLIVPIFIIGSLKQENDNSSLDSYSDLNNNNNNNFSMEVTVDGSENAATIPPVLSSTTFDDNNLKASDLFYFIATIIIINQLAQKIIMNLSDAFCANVALKTNSSYSSIRFWGAVGRTSCAFLLIFVNEIEPFLVPALTILTILSTLNVLVIAFWPNRKQFDLSENIKIPIDSEKIKFSYRRSNFLWPLFSKKMKVNHYISDDGLHLANLSKGKNKNNSVYIKKASLTSHFDSREEDLFRNIRRCSLAPLGDSYVIKQFDLDNKNVKHFNHVTKIEPIIITNDLNNMKRSRSGSSGMLIKTIDLPTRTLDNIEINQNNNNNTYEWKPPATMDMNSSNRNEDNKFKMKRNSIDLSLNSYETTSNKEENYIEFKLYLRIIMMIGLKNKLVIRFMLLYILNGMVAGVNWSYLFPYLYSIDSDKFNRLSAYVMISRYLSETIFYSVASKYFKSFDPSNSLSLILLVYGLRYLPYVLLGTSILPLEVIILIESLRAFNMGWFNCVMNEAAIHFALEAEKCVPELVNSGHIENNQETIDKVNNGFKATMVVISACCFDGIGLGLGSFIGGHVIDFFGYKTLWIGTGTFSILMCILNWLTDLGREKVVYDSKRAPKV